MTPDQKTQFNEPIEAVRAQEARLARLTDLTDEVRLPPALLFALSTGRTELLRAAKPEALTAEVIPHVLHAFAVLIDTNRALREHARQADDYARKLEEMIIGTAGAARRLRGFVNFETQEPSDGD